MATSSGDTSGSGGTSSGGNGSTNSGGTGGAGGTGMTCPSGECSAECPCETGEGVCTSDDQCESGLVCTAAAVTKLDFTVGAMSCMPSHCDNDELDEDDGETSQDCGGECGCRATYEEIAFTGLPAGTEIVALTSLSGDGSVLVGNANGPGGVSTAIPIVVSATSGTVGILPHYEVAGGAQFVSDDGSFIVGVLACNDPPDCTDGSSAPFRWVDGDNPIQYPFDNTIAGMSASGNVVVFTRTTCMLPVGSYPPEIPRTPKSSTGCVASRQMAESSIPLYSSTTTGMRFGFHERARS